MPSSVGVPWQRGKGSLAGRRACAARGVAAAVGAALSTIAWVAIGVEPSHERGHAHRAPAAADAGVEDASANAGDPVDASADRADAADARDADAEASAPPPEPVPLPTGCAASLEALQRALGRVPSVDALAELAACEEDRGLVASAARHFDRLAAALPARDGRRASAIDRAAALAPRVPRWRLRRPTTPRPEGASLTLDGKPIDDADLGVEAPIDPGPHVIEVRARGFPSWRAEVRVGEGARVDVALAWPAPPPPPEPRPWGSRSRAAVWIDEDVAVRSGLLLRRRDTPEAALGIAPGVSFDLARRRSTTAVIDVALPVGIGVPSGTAELGDVRHGVRVAWGPRWLRASVGGEVGVPTRWSEKSTTSPADLLSLAGGGELRAAYLTGVRGALPLSLEAHREPFAVRVFVRPPSSSRSALIPWNGSSPAASSSPRAPTRASSATSRRTGSSPRASAARPT